MNLYFVTDGYYQLMIVIIKMMLAEDKCDICIDTRVMPNFPIIKCRLKELNLFNNIIEYDGTQARIELHDENRIKKFFSHRRFCKSLFNKYSPLSLKQIQVYDNIYIFNANGPIERHILHNKIPFHLIENGLDFYAYFDDFYQMKNQDYTPGTLRFKLREIFGLSHIASYAYAIDTEVNNIKIIKIPTDRVIESSRKEMFNALSPEQKQCIYNIFSDGGHIDSYAGKKMLLCTRPLFDDKYVNSEDEQIKVVEKIIEKYVSDGYYVVIKPHPRDLADYTTIQKKYKCGYIDRTMPSEILNFNLQPNYDLAVGIATSSVDALECVAKSIYIDRNQIEQICREINV